MRAVLEPENGTFELRRRRHAGEDASRGDVRDCWAGPNRPSEPAGSVLASATPGTCVHRAPAEVPVTGAA